MKGLMNITSSRCSGWSATLPLAKVRDEEWKLRGEIRNFICDIWSVSPIVNLEIRPGNVKVLVLEAITIDVERSLMTSLSSDILVLKSYYVTGVVSLQLEVMSAFTIIVQKNLIGPIWLHMLLPTCLNPLITFLTIVYFWDTRRLPLLPKSQPLLCHGLHHHLYQKRAPMQCVSIEGKILNFWGICAEVWGKHTSQKENHYLAKNWFWKLSCRPPNSSDLLCC